MSETKEKSSSTFRSQLSDAIRGTEADYNQISVEDCKGLNKIYLCMKVIEILNCILLQYGFNSTNSMNIPNSFEITLFKINSFNILTIDSLIAFFSKMKRMLA